jgi:glycosyltransferase involved in cell wall biosynthesis
MPTYDGARYVAAALDSVVAQGVDELGGVEVLVLDDGSTDGTPDIVRAYEGSLDLRVTPGARSGSWPASVNRGLAMARGTYATMLHQDDVWRPGRLAALRPLCDGARVLVSHDVTYVDEDGQPLGPLRAPLPGGDVPPATLLEALLVQNFFAVPGVTFAVEAARAAGGLDESLWFTADWDLWLSLAAAGPAYHLHRPLAGYRVHGGALTLTGSGDSAGFRGQLTTVLDRHLARVPAPVASRALAAARLSVEMNVALAALHRRDVRTLRPLLATALRTPPGSWRRYARDSLIGARVRSRLALTRHSPSSASSPSRNSGQ